MSMVPPVIDKTDHQKLVGTTPAVLTQWYSPCLGLWDLKRGSANGVQVKVLPAPALSLTWKLVWFL